MGSSGGVRFVPFGNPAATATMQVAATPANNRGAGVFEGNLYVSSSTSAGGFYGLTQISTGLPATAGQQVALLPGFPSAVPTGGTTPSPYGFYFADLSASVPGLDVVYVADDRAAPDGGLQKWSLVGGAWTLNGTVTGVAARGLSGSLAGSTVSLAVSGSGGLYFLTDNAGYNAAPSTTVFPSPIATPGTNSPFRGVVFSTVVPVITSISPGTAVAGNIATTLILTGSGFISNSIANISGPVSFIGLPTTLVSGTQLTVSLPAYAPAANYLVSLVNSPGFGGIGTNSVPFALTAAPNAPTITGLTPLGGSTGTVITVTGTNFTGATAVRLVNTTAGPATTPVNVLAFTVASAMTITFTLPVTPTQVRVLVTTPNGTAVSSGIFNIITATKPAEALPGLAVAPTRPPTASR